MRKRLILGLLLIAGCDEDSSCFDTLSCPDAETSTGGTTGSGGGTSGGSAGTGNADSGGSGGVSTTSSSGASAGGSSASVGGAGGAGGTLGGASGAGGAPDTCDDACGGSTPVCDDATATCVQCLDSTAHCDAPTPACDPDSHECVECVGPADCDAGVCDPETHACVECLETEDCDEPMLCDPEQLCVECLGDGDCTNPLEAHCDAGSCSPCQSNDDCAHLAGTTVCDTGVGECVECTGTDYASCGVNEDEEPLVCDTLTRTCSIEIEHDRGLCEPCLADANCAPGQLCVLQTFEEQDVGYFCFWERGALEGGAPASCGTARPYVDTLSVATSIDGSVADICGLAVSTCVARSQFRTEGCGTTIPDDSLCGVAPPADAVCVEFDTDVHRCTMTCLSSDDCPPGSPCNDAVTNPYCEL